MGVSLVFVLSACSREQTTHEEPRPAAPTHWWEAEAERESACTWPAGPEAGSAEVPDRERAGPAEATEPYVLVPECPKLLQTFDIQDLQDHALVTLSSGETRIVGRLDAPVGDGSTYVEGFYVFDPLGDTRLECVEPGAFFVSWNRLVATGSIVWMSGKSPQRDAAALVGYDLERGEAVLSKSLDADDFVYSEPRILLATSTGHLIFAGTYRPAKRPHQAPRSYLSSVSIETGEVAWVRKDSDWTQVPEDEFRVFSSAREDLGTGLIHVQLTNTSVTTLDPCGQITSTTRFTDLETEDSTLRTMHLGGATLVQRDPLISILDWYRVHLFDERGDSLLELRRCHSPVGMSDELFACVDWGPGRSSVRLFTRDGEELERLDASAWAASIARRGGLDVEDDSVFITNLIAVDADSLAGLITLKEEGTGALYSYAFVFLVSENELLHVPFEPLKDTSEAARYSFITVDDLMHTSRGVLVARTRGTFWSWSTGLEFKNAPPYGQGPKRATNAGFPTPMGR